MSFYLLFNLMLAIGCVFSFVLRLMNKRFTLLTAKSEHQLNHVFLAAVIVMSIGISLLPVRTFVFHPVSRTEFGQTISRSMNTFSKAVDGRSRFEKSETNQSHQPSLSDFFSIVALLISCFYFVKLLRDYRKLYRILENSFLIKQIGRCKVLSNENIHIPFSYFGISTAYTVLPSSMQEDSNQIKISTLHELQHHRQGDTRFVWAIQILKTLNAWNPCVHLWSNQLSIIQEFACDEALLGQKKISWQAYARCLFQVAQTARCHENTLACATGLIFMTEGKTLKRRIEKMKTKNKAWNASFVRAALVITGVVTMTSRALAAKDIASSRTITRDEAIALATTSNHGAGIPVTINDSVMTELNHFVGTPEGRSFLRESLIRMKTHETLIDSKIAEYKMPKELKAIPIIESGYQNLKQSEVSAHGAGLWMFIKSTATKYGMKVNAKRDERLHVPTETDAAMRYLKSNYTLFNDWELSILSYNVGESSVAKAMAKTGKKDAWSLINTGVYNDDRYLPKIMAAILIMKNPQLLD